MFSLFAQFTIFAHVGEAHAQTADSLSHLIDTWYTGLLLAIAAVAVVGAFVYFLFQKSVPAAFLAVNFALLVIGVFSYGHSAVVSVFCLSIGFAMCLGGVLAALLVKPGH